MYLRCEATNGYRPSSRQSCSVWPPPGHHLPLQHHEQHSRQPFCKRQRVEKAHTAWKAEAELDRRAMFLLSTAAAAVLLNPPQIAAAPSTVFVAGASGKTGRKIVAYLTSQGIAVRAGVRDIEKARASGLDQGGKVTLVNGDVTAGPEKLAEAIGNAEAVICATGFSGGKKDVPCAAASCSTGADGYDLVDRQGTINLVDAAKQRGVSKFVLMTSLLTNARAMGQGLNPIFLLINGFGGVLDKKHKAEEYLRESGLNWTIVRPGGLSMDPPSEVGSLVIRGEDTLRGLPTDPGRAISRQTVAEVLVQAVLQPDASKDRVYEIVASKSAPALQPDKWFRLQTQS